MFGPSHPLKGLSNEIDAIHDRSEHGTHCSHTQCHLQQKLQENGPYAREIMLQIGYQIDLWLQGEPNLLPYRDEALAAIQDADMGSPGEMIMALKMGAKRLTDFFTQAWAERHRSSEVYRASDRIMHSIHDETGLHASPDVAIKLGYNTAISFLGNVYQLSYEVVKGELGRDAVTPERVASVARCSADIAQLMASCRKDVFMGIQNQLFVPHSHRQDRLMVAYRPEKFTLVGSEAAENLQLSLKSEVLNRLRGEMHGLVRAQCPSMGQAFRSFVAWQQGVYEKYFTANIDKLMAADMRS